MHPALISFPFTTAIAVGTGARVGGGLKLRLPGVGMRTSPHPIDRGVSR
jgi:hypothetical protein